ncbi:MAG: nuclear transport factor 2 family protein [Rhodobacteraceae bacterium]|nr:nuclear transport factor 2 family protein [Paracoccaceae bacterium]
MSDRDAVLFANTAFYAAFYQRDFEAMAEVWAKGRPISCTHPGWATLYGSDAVIESWRGILSNRNAPKIKCRAENVEILGEAAIVTCVEDFGDGQYLAATNVFIRVGHVWAMVHHQAGPANVDPATLGEQDDEPAGPVN